MHTDVRADSAVPLVSVVTPSFNQAEFLEETILSVLSQNYPNLEYLILDGGSTDGSVDIIRKYQDRLAYWVSESDAGQTDAINRGWGLARGEILAYLNSDDLYLPGAVSAAVRFFRSRPDVGIVYGACEFLDQGGDVVARIIPPDFSLSRLLLGNFLAQPSVFLRKTVLKQIGPLDTSLRYCMDYDLWVRAAVAGIQIARVPGLVLARFRIWWGSKTSTASEAGLNERLLILERAFSSGRLPREVMALREYARARACMTVAYGEFLNGDMRVARRFLCRSVVYSGRIAYDPQFLMLWVATLAGARCSRFLRRAKWWVKRWLGGHPGPLKEIHCGMRPIPRAGSEETTP